MTLQRQWIAGVLPRPPEMFVVLTGTDGQCGHMGSVVIAHAYTGVSLLCS